VSVRETALASLLVALADALGTRSPAPLLLRNETIPQRLPPGSLVVLHDGEAVEATPLLSPLAWTVEHRAEVEVTVAGTTAVARTTLLDAILADIAAAIAAHRTLGGAVEWAQAGAPSFEDVEFDGAAAVRAASVAVTLFFTAAGSPLS